MSRRKKGKNSRPEQPPPEAVSEGPIASPPRPNRPLLAFAIVLTLLWVGALLTLAIWT